MAATTNWARSRLLLVCCSSRFASYITRVQSAGGEGGRVGKCYEPSYWAWALPLVTELVKGYTAHWGPCRRAYWLYRSLPLSLSHSLSLSVSSNSCFWPRVHGWPQLPLPRALPFFECFIKSQSRLPKNKTEQNMFKHVCTYHTLCIPLCPINYTITSLHCRQQYSRSSSPASSACLPAKMVSFVHTLCVIDIDEYRFWVPQSD